MCVIKWVSILDKSIEYTQLVSMGLRFYSEKNNLTQIMTTLAARNVKKTSYKILEVNV